MTTLVIPDLHHRVAAAEEWIARYPADRVVFLGDYFDDFDDTPKMAEATAEWLKDSLAKPGRLHLWGNHDLWYRFPMNPQVCWFGAGFTPEKSKIISSVLEAADWARLELVEFVDGIALSHAGIGSSVFAPPIGALTKERVERLCAEAWLDAEAGLPNPVFDLSGIVWLRWWNLRPLEAFSQFVGHTPDRALRIDRGVATANACLDSFGRYLGWIEDGFMSVLDDHRGEPVWGMETRTA
jgi:hypothetical protein